MGVLNWWWFNRGVYYGGFMWWLIIGGILLVGFIVALFIVPDFKQYRIMKRTYGSGSIKYFVECCTWSGVYGGWVTCGEFLTKQAAEETMQKLIEVDANSRVIKEEIL